MPPYYYDTCIHVGYSMTMLFLTSFMASLGCVCAMYYTDVYPREKRIVDLQNSLELVEGELTTVREEESQEHTRRRLAEVDIGQLRNDLEIAQAELRRAQEDLHISKRDNDIYTVVGYLSIMLMGFYGIYRIVGPLQLYRTEL